VTYLLDTNACVAILRDKSSNVVRRVAQETPGNVALCSVVKAELYYGAYKSQQSARTLAQILAKLNRLVSAFHSYPFDDNAAERYGRVRADLAVQGNLIGPNDLMIAAIALANHVTLVTHNTREFGRVLGYRGLGMNLKPYPEYKDSGVLWESLSSSRQC
jgi:tRNA(fMet)-specific endonuclease VapC